MQKITPFLWFNGRAEEAVNFYTSIFPDSKIVQLSKLPGGPSPGSVIATFQIEGQQFMALDGGPQFTFTPAISLMVNCETQAEVDTLWDKLSGGGGKSLQCGWPRRQIWHLLANCPLGRGQADAKRRSGKTQNASLPR